MIEKALTYALGTLLACVLAWGIQYHLSKLNNALATLQASTQAIINAHH